MNIVADLDDRNLINTPKWLPTSIQLLVTVGSVSYGVSTDNSDHDVYGVCIPSKEEIFPHLAGYIEGFGKQKKRFGQWIQHHIEDKDRRCNYDITVANIVKYFNLVMKNNPNCLDVLFSPQDCILHITQAGQLIRENRRMFLHKGSFHTHKGYAYSSMNKMTNRNKRLEKVKKLEEKYDVELTLQAVMEELNYRQLTDDNDLDEDRPFAEIPDGTLFECSKILSSKRNQKILQEDQKFDLKFATHCVRLLLQAEQILSEGDLDLRRNSEHLKAIRRGDLSEEEIRSWASDQEKYLEKLYHESKIPYGPNEAKIKDLLLQVLESHYGSLDKCVERVDKYQVAFDKIREIVDNVV